MVGGGTVVNQGGATISGNLHTGVYLRSGGGSTVAFVSNAAGGLITGYHGIQVDAGNGSVSNSGTLAGLTKAAIDFLDGGIVMNEQSGSILETGTLEAVYISGSLGLVLNSGSVSAAANGKSAIALAAGGTVVNGAGGVVSAPAQSGLYINATIAAAGAYVSNAARRTDDGYHGIGIFNGAGSVSNAGIVIGLTKSAIDLNGGGFVTNALGGTIAGQGTNAIYTDLGLGTVVNDGLITATGASHNGIVLENGGFVSNTANGTIAAGAARHAGLR